MQHSEIVACLDELGTLLADRGIYADNAISILAIAIADLINGSCEHPGDRARCVRTVTEAIAGRTGVHIAIRFRSPDGSDKIVN